MRKCRGHDPLFQASRRSLPLQFTVNAPLLCPLFSIFRNFLHFQPCFDQNFSSLGPNFSKFLFPRPPFLKENPLLRPYILKPAWHTLTKKKLSSPRSQLLPPFFWGGGAGSIDPCWMSLFLQSVRVADLRLEFQSFSDRCTMCTVDLECLHPQWFKGD